MIVCVLMSGMWIREAGVVISEKLRSAWEGGYVMFFEMSPCELHAKFDYHPLPPSRVHLY